MSASRSLASSAAFASPPHDTGLWLLPTSGAVLAIIPYFSSFTLEYADIIDVAGFGRLLCLGDAYGTDYAQSPRTFGDARARAIFATNRYYFEGAASPASARVAC